MAPQYTNQKYDGKSIRLPDIGRKAIFGSILNGDKITVNQTEHGIEIAVPEDMLDKHDTIVMLKLDAPV